VALTSATQLRMGGVPLGTGEVLLLVWAMVVMGLLLYQDRLSVAPAVRPFVVFWLLAYPLLALAWTLAPLRGINSKTATHDMIAFSFLCVMIGTMVLRPWGAATLRTAAKALMLFTVVPVTGLLAVAATGRFSVGPLNLWVGRFYGWSANPNQVALAMLAVPFVALYLLRGRRSAAAAAGWGLVILCAVAVGLASLSDALMLAWVVGATVAAAGWWTRIARRRTLPFWTAAGVWILLPALLLAAAVLVGYPAYQSLSEAGSTVYDQGGQGSVRMVLWTYGVDAIAASPLVGNGPGSHSGLVRVFDGGEAHNSYIDWGASTGLLGVALFLGMLGVVLARVVRSGQMLLVGLVVSLCVFSIFHYILRQPLYWFLLIFAACEAQRHLEARAGTGDGAPPPAPAL
jgi:O-antigen ligase